MTRIGTWRDDKGVVHQETGSRIGTWRDDKGVVHQGTGSLRASVGGWTMLMWCGVEVTYDPSYNRLEKRTIDCMTCLVKGST